nr:hypothetical protein AsloCp17 [Euglena longa]CAC24588.1 hypothetical protein [Euglena longa]
MTITNIKFFISKSKSKHPKKLKIFHPVNEFFDIEEIKENLSNICINLKKLRFKFNPKNNKEKKTFIILNSFNKKSFSAKDIIIPSTSNLKIVNLKEHLFNKISQKINLKVLIKIENNENYFYNPIKRINFILEKNNNIGKYIILDLNSDININPFKAFIESLKYLNLNNT